MTSWLSAGRDSRLPQAESPVRTTIRELKRENTHIGTKKTRPRKNSRENTIPETIATDSVRNFFVPQSATSSMSEQRPSEGKKESCMPSLRSYLSRMRSLAFSGTRHEQSTIVMGNPSADLDSFISAVVTSYFYNLESNARYSKGKTYIPALNLPAVKASDLWRLRPEYGVALRLALGESADAVNEGEAGSQGKTAELEDLVTIADIRADGSSSLHKLFSDSKAAREGSSGSEMPEKQPLFLVDHNSPLIAGLSDEVISSRFNVTGCIDHHVDENFVSQDAAPRIITTGIGSCTSLVVKHLRDQGMWPTPSDSTQEHQALQEISKLALAPILIDTNNLRASGDKCSDTDREVVRFLDSIITASPSKVSTSTASSWSRSTFHSTISSVKSNSLNLLSMPEIFDRDYKVWTETTSSGHEVNIGISSLVRPLSWLMKHASGTDDFLISVSKFATDPERKLGVFCALTRTGDGRKEVAVLSFDDAVSGVMTNFEEEGPELQLKKWDENRELLEALTQRFGAKEEGKWKIWFMGDTSKSRKQVGPLLREVVRKM